MLTAVENALTIEKEATVRRAGALAVKMLFAGLDKDIVEVCVCVGGVSCYNCNKCSPCPPVWLGSPRISERVLPHS